MRLALWMHPGPFSETFESSTGSGCSPLRMGADSLRMLCDVKCFQFDLVMMQLLLQERVMPVFLTSLNQVN